MKRVHPLLKSEHFVDGVVSLTTKGLDFDELIGDDERRTAGLGAAVARETLDHIASRASTRIILNPSNLSLSDLFETLKNAQTAHQPGEEINVGYKLPFAYQRSWDSKIDEDGVQEGQMVVMTAFDPINVVGYVGLRISIEYLPARRALYCHVRPTLIYVVPDRRGSGYGIDLSIACGMLCRDLLRAIYRAVPPHTTVSATMSVDYESKGGEAFAQYVIGEMEAAVDMLDEYGGRKTIEFGSVDLDAGY